MDFWAQHKDFILKVLAGLGVFLVALIARGITYGDELEKARGKNSKLAGQIARLEIAPVAQINDTERDAEVLVKNAETITKQLGWDLGDPGLEVELLSRILGYTRRYRDQAVAQAAKVREAIREDLDGGFGQLRLLVRQDLEEEANEKNIPLLEGVGYGEVLEIADGTLFQHLMQLELAARLARYAIDANVDSVQDIEIEAKQAKEAIPDANPEFLREYPVKISFRTDQKGVIELINRLESETPRVQIREIDISRLTRPANHLSVDLTVVALAANPDPKVPFVKAGENQ